MEEMSKEKLLKQLQMCDFILFETALYLDTHKTDKEALAYYKKHQEMAEKYRLEYISKYGPLTINDSKSDEKWEWVIGQWPWEFQG